MSETCGVANLQLLQTNRQYRKDSDKLFDIMEQLEKLSYCKGDAALDDKLKEELKCFQNLHISVTSEAEVATYLQGYRDAYMLFREIGIF